MKEALQVAHLTPETIGYINAHGTSTPFRRQSRTRSGGASFSKCSQIKTSPYVFYKIIHTHLLGASSVLEAFFFYYGFTSSGRSCHTEFDFF